MAFLQKNEARLYEAKIEAKENGVISTKKGLEFAKYFDYWYKTYKENSVAGSTLRHYILSSSIIRQYFGAKKLQENTRINTISPLVVQKQSLERNNQQSQWPHSGLC